MRIYLSFRREHEDEHGEPGTPRRAPIDGLRRPTGADPADARTPA